MPQRYPGIYLNPGRGLYFSQLACDPDLHVFGQTPLDSESQQTFNAHPLRTLDWTGGNSHRFKFVLNSVNQTLETFVDGILHEAHAWTKFCGGHDVTVRIGAGPHKQAMHPSSGEIRLVSYRDLLIV